MVHFSPAFGASVFQYCRRRGALFAHTPSLFTGGRMGDAMSEVDLFNQPLSEQPEFLTFNQAMTLFRRLHWDRKQMSSHADCLIRYMVAFFDGRSIHTITRLDVERLRHHLDRGRGLKVSTVNKAHMILRLMYNQLYRWREDRWADGIDLAKLQLPAVNPAALVRMPKAVPDQPFHEPDVVAAYIKIAKGLAEKGYASSNKATRKFAGHYERCALGFKLGWTFRISPIDLWSLNDDEIDDRRFEIRIWRRHTMTDRNPQGNLQVIRLTESTWADIERLRRFRSPGEKRIFPLSLGQRKRALYRIRAIAKQQGWPSLTWLDLRRGAGGFLDEEGFDVRDRADALGHTNTKTTVTYYSKRVNPRSRDFTEALDRALR